MATSDDLDDLVRHWMDELGIPGLGLGIYREGEKRVLPYGVTAIETGFPVRPDTIFQVGSISKLFTAILCMTLVEEEKLDLDQPVQRYVPEFALQDRTAAEEITTRHLLAHTAGFWGDWFADFGLGEDAMERFVAQYSDLHQLTAPGELWTYNNCGYILAGLVAARITGQPFDTALRERVIEPLGLDHTFLSAAEAIAYPVAIGHLSDPATGEPQVTRSFLRPRARNPAGGVLASVEDILAFGRFALTGRPEVLKRETLAAMQEPAAETYELATHWGLGFRIEHRGDVRLVGHGGSTNGFQALLTLVPERQFAAVVLTNSDRGGKATRKVIDGILEHELGLPRPEYATITLAASDLDALVGRYEQPYATIEIRHDDGLRARLMSDSPYSERQEAVAGEWSRLRPVASDHFVFESGDMEDVQVHFWRDGSGDVRFVQTGGRLYRLATGE